VDRFGLTPDIRRQAEEHIDKAIMRVYDDINWTPSVWTREELTVRMHWVQGIRNKILQDLINISL